MAKTGRLLTLLAFLAFISLGLPDTLLGVAWPSIREAFGRPLSDVGYLLACATAGYLASSFFGGSIVERLGVGRLLAASAALVAASLLVYALSPVWPGLFLAALIGGVGAGAIDAGVNAFAARAFSPRVMNWLHGFWGVGATLGPLAMTAAITRGFGWRGGYGAIAGVMVGLTAVFALTIRLWHASPAAGTDEHRPESRSGSGTLDALRRPMVVGQMLFYFAYAGVEFGAGTWLYTLLHEGRGASVATAGALVSGYWAALAVGRMIFGQIAASVGPIVILRVALGATVVAATLLASIFPFGITCAGTLLLGLGLAPLFPTTMSITPTRVGDRDAAHAIGFQVSAAAVGIMVNPWLIGIAARYHGIGTLPYALLGGAILLLAINEALERGAAARRAREIVRG